jgi:MOSC domain-containing protein YiiM
MSLTKQGKVLELYVSTEEKRDKKEDISLELPGVVGDKFFNKNVDRSVLIGSLYSYELAKEKGIDLPLGSLGENILIDINPYNLDKGDRIMIGDVELEITNHCTLCKSLAKVDGKLPKILCNDRGIFAKTIKAGRIKNGDSVTIPNSFKGE